MIFSHRCDRREVGQDAEDDNNRDIDSASKQGTKIFFFEGQMRNCGKGALGA